MLRNPKLGACGASPILAVFFEKKNAYLRTEVFFFTKKNGGQEKDIRAKALTRLKLP
jgi:hypothetical protein